ncbi:MAG: AMMECR1 domain-containing protein [Candidatus Gracilibacteria bacterium]|nr:AMMECR1 domain-containing protein [Candidatus Gracilibacteria bacterium]
MKELLNVSLNAIKFYLEKGEKPTIKDFTLKDNSLLTKTGCIFVTLYKDGEVRGSSGNVKEIENSVVDEVIVNTIEAITNDKRFGKITKEEINNLKIRIDYIKKRDLLSEGKIYNLNPLESGVIVITKDYSDLAVILPNISKKLFAGEDFIPVIEEKLGKKFEEKDYYKYEIKTDVFSNL